MYNEPNVSLNITWQIRLVWFISLFYVHISKEWHFVSLVVVSVDCIAVVWPQCGSKGLSVRCSLVVRPEEEAFTSADFTPKAACLVIVNEPLTSTWQGSYVLFLYLFVYLCHSHAAVANIVCVCLLTGCFNLVIEFVKGIVNTAIKPKWHCWVQWMIWFVCVFCSLKKLTFSCDSWWCSLDND